MSVLSYGQTVRITGNQVTVDGKRLVGIADCTLGFLGMDGPCRGYSGDCANEPKGEERFVDIQTYSTTYRAAGFNTFRGGVGGFCSFTDPDQLVPIFQEFKRD